MKKIIVSLLSIFVVISLFGFSVSLAQEESTSIDQETADEINDDLSEQVNAFQVGMAKINIWLTFNQEKKAEKELKLARLELIRARIAAKNNNSASMENALEAHNRILERVQARIESIDGKSTEEGIKNTAEKLVGLERSIEIHEARIAKLREILTDENLTEEQIKNIQTRMDKAEESAENLKEVEVAKKEKIKTRLMDATEMTEEQADEEIRKIEDSQNLDAVRNRVAEINALRAENAIRVISKVIARREAGISVSANSSEVDGAVTALTAVRDRLRSTIESQNQEQTQITNQQGN